MESLKQTRQAHRHALIQLSIARQMWEQAHPNHCTTCEGSGKVADGEDCYGCLEHEINPLDISQCGIDVGFVGGVAESTWWEWVGQYVNQEQETRSAYYNARLEYEREQLGEDQWG